MVGVILLIVFLSPVLSRTGTWNELRRWECPEPNPWGHPNPLYLSVETFRSYFDPLGAYAEERLLVGDGGYAYVLSLDLPAAHAANEWLDGCDVAWNKEGVSLHSLDGLKIEIAAATILDQL